MTRNRFKAHCRIRHTPATLTFDDGALFEAHMLEAHGAKPGQWAKRLEHKEKNVGWASMGIAKPIRAGWRGPRLTEAGAAFEPEGWQPGATVTWKQHVEGREVERSGQVWSLGDWPKSVWVIPFDPRHEDEAAVLVRQLGSGRLEVQQTYFRGRSYQDAS